ncbi:MAG: DegV family protein [Clostridia bacterium]|nr:DegV family protein [Clostridia bacterium]
MNKFVIVSDSCCDLGLELRKKYDIEYLPMSVAYDDVTMVASLDWEETSAKEYYGVMRQGKRVFTSQVPPAEYKERFEKYISEGYDILSISCSSMLSASVKASYVVRDELKEKYPNSEIICIDSLISGGGLGLLCIYASILRAEGKTIKEVASSVEKIKMIANQAGTVGDLKYLKMAGRISAGKAFFGTIMNVKPLIISNVKGENVSVDKAKGRAKSIRLLADNFFANYTGKGVDDILVSQADCEEDANVLIAMIKEKMPEAKITLGTLNPVMGASCGPDTLIVYFIGKDKPNTDE